MSGRRSAAIPPETLTADQRREVASWLTNRVDEMHIDQETIGEEIGWWFLPALRGLAASLRKRAKP